MQLVPQPSGTQVLYTVYIHVHTHATELAEMEQVAGKRPIAERTAKQRESAAERRGKGEERQKQKQKGRSVPVIRTP